MRVSRLKDLTCVSLLLASLSPMYAPQEAAAAVPDSLAVKANTVMVSPYHASDKDLTTAAVSSVGGWQLEYLPGINRTNLLNGRVTGFLGIQHDGELGIESNSMYIRGLRSISSDSRQAAILVDGYVRKDANRISPADIESVTILKDAAATALYGLRGANGVVLITTKHGRIQPLTVSIDAGVGFQAPTRLPKYLGSYDYARLYNEAAVNDGGSPKYDQYALDSYLSGDDPYNYPDVDWMDRFMKKSSVVQRYNVSVRGGTEQASGSGKVNLNTAGKEELMTLSGIGESRADAIIAYREANGPFGSIEEIMNIEGIKEKMFEKIRGSIEV